MGLVIAISGLLRVAAMSTAISIVLGLGLAWLLVNRQFPCRRELGVLVSVALALPAPALCYYLWSGRNQLWSWGLTAAAILSALPMMVRAARAAFSSLDPVFGKAGRTLGASDWRIFWRIELPLIFRPAAAAAGLAFARVFAELAAASFIAVRLAP